MIHFWKKQVMGFFICRNRILLGLGIYFLFVLHFNAQSRVYPEPPVLLTPVDGGLYQFPGVGGLIHFSWEPVSGAAAYEFNARVGLRPVAPVVTEDVSVQLDLRLKESDSEAVVSWSVRSIQNDVKADTVSIFSFTFGEKGVPLPGVTPVPTAIPTAAPGPLPAPQLLSPEDGAMFGVLDGLRGIQFEWGEVTGAARYLFIVYQDNVPLYERQLQSTQSTERISTSLQDIFQWDARAIDSNETVGSAGPRFSFTVGSELPTPTPVPLNPDVNQDGAISAADLYYFAQIYRTNDPSGDFDNSGLIDQNDLLRFVDLYFGGR